MTDLLSSYGLPLLAGTIFAACLALPIPAFLLMLSAGALAASGALSLTLAVASALLGAVAADQCGYHFGHHIAPLLHRLLHRHPGSERILIRAERLLCDHGGLGVFLSRWLLAPLGPSVNLLSGTADLPWYRFTLWAVAGRVLWVGLYCGLGFAFAHQLPRIAIAARHTSTVLTLLALIALAIFLLHRRTRRR